MHTPECRLPGSFATGQTPTDHRYLSPLCHHLPFPIKKGRVNGFTLPSNFKVKKAD
jgi:hypothetical protein